jgi:O-antigen/teichoic acid export membrane protein
MLSLAAAAVGLRSVHMRHGLAIRATRPRASDVRRGLSYAGTLLSFSVQEDADKVLLVRLADPVLAGLYAAAYRGVQIATMPLRALVVASHRTFLEPADGPGAHVRRTLRFTVPAAAYAAVATAGLLVLAPLVPWLLGPEYDGSQAMFMLLAPLVLLRGLAHLPFNALMGLGRNDLRLAIVAVCAVLSTGLCVVLIPLHSWTGAAVATLVSEATFVVLTWLALLHCQRSEDRATTAPDPGERGGRSASDAVALGTGA